MRQTPSLRSIIALGAALALAFLAGWAAASQPGINPGLVTALASVGQNLFGEDAFGARIYPPEPCRDPLGADGDPCVSLDIADQGTVPVLLNVFLPPDPIEPEPVCETYFQVAVRAEGVTLFVDPDAAPADFDTNIVFESLEDYPPVPCIDGAIIVEPPGE